MATIVLNEFKQAYREKMFIRQKRNNISKTHVFQIILNLTKPILIIV